MIELQPEESSLSLIWMLLIGAAGLAAAGALVHRRVYYRIDDPAVETPVELTEEEIEEEIGKQLRMNGVVNGDMLPVLRHVNPVDAAPQAQLFLL